MGELCPVDKTFVFTNRKDRAIRAAQAIIRRKSPSEEATIEGLANAGKLNLCSVTSIDVFEEAGRFHSVERYTRSGTLQIMMADLVNSVSVNRATIVSE
jgi:50S ribosomal subunit-associated GTPase HflX